MMEAFFESGAICSLDSKKCLIGYGEQIWSEKPLQYPCWYAPDFFLKNPKPYLHFSHTQEIAKEKLLQPHTPITHTFNPINWNHFDHFFEKFQNSKLKKVVPYIAKKAHGVVSIQDMLSHSLQYQTKNPHTSVYGFWNAQEGILGASPELVLSLDHTGTLRTDACAGTLPIALADTMLTNQKLLDEHNLVIEGLQNALGEVTIGTTTVVKFSKIAHLFTPIEMKGIFDINKIIHQIHPSPAIGAYPKESGIQYLQELNEKTPRGRFGAPFGALKSQNEARIHLAIRNIQWEKEKIQLMAGCGIVSGSLILEEKKEIKHKLAAIQEILGIL